METNLFENPITMSFNLLGYDLKRQAIVFEFDNSVCADRKYRLSLASALDRTIKDSYGLDESEIRILDDVSLPDQKIDNFHRIAFYDFDGNMNLPMKKIFDEFDTNNQTG